MIQMPLRWPMIQMPLQCCVMKLEQSIHKSIEGRSVVDSNTSLASNHEIMNDLQAMHDLSSCDTVTRYYGIGKAVSLRVLRGQKHSLGWLVDYDFSPYSTIVQLYDGGYCLLVEGRT
jgi:hypothetical protein